MCPHPEMKTVNIFVILILIFFKKKTFKSVIKLKSLLSSTASSTPLPHSILMGTIKGLVSKSLFIYLHEHICFRKQFILLFYMFIIKYT